MIRKYKISNLFHNKVNNFFLLVYCILHGLPRSTVFVFYIENHQIASVNHISISRLVCSFGIYLFIRVIHIDFVIVCSVALHIEIACLRRIWHTHKVTLQVYFTISFPVLHGKKLRKRQKAPDMSRFFPSMPHKEGSQGLAALGARYYASVSSSLSSSGSGASRL